MNIEAVSALTVIAFAVISLLNVVLARAFVRDLGKEPSLCRVTATGDLLETYLCLFRQVRGGYRSLQRRLILLAILGSLVIVSKSFELALVLGFSVLVEILTVTYVVKAGNISLK